MYNFYVYNIVHVHISLIAPKQLNFQFLAQDIQIEEGGSQDFLIQNVSGSTVYRGLKMTLHHVHCKQVLS